MASRKRTDKKEKKGGKTSDNDRTVLIVDDMKDNRLLLQTVLKAKGYTVHLAANGEDALKVLRSHTPDLIISDILMPVMDGFQLCRACKADRMLQRIPFVFYSATYTSEKDRDFALSLGAERFLLKPAKPKVFLAAIEEVLAEHQDGTLVAGEGPMKEEDELLVLYNQRLINKLEDKMFELEDTNKLLESVFDHTHILVAYLDRKGTFIRVNRALAEVCRRKPSSFTGKSLFDILSDGECKKKFRQVIRTGEPHFCASHPLAFGEHKGKGIQYWDASLVPIRNAEGTVTHLLLTLVDTTARKQAEDEIKASEERYRYMYESAQELHLCLDLKGTITDVSRAGLDLIGYAKNEVVGKSFRKFVPVKYVPIILKNLALDAVGRTSPVMEIEIKAKDGRLIPLEFAPGSVPLYEDDKLVGVMVSARDVSYRKEAERALRESQERYRLCTTAAKVGVWDWDIANGTFYLDPVIKSFLGYTDEEIPNDLEKWVTYVHPDDSGPVMQAAQDCLDGKTPAYVYEHRMLHKDGSVRWVRVDGTVIRDEKGKPIRMLGTDTDITERKKAEERLQEAVTIINRSQSVAFTWRNVEGWPVEFASSNVSGLFGHSAADFIAGKVAYDKVVHPDDLERVAEEVATYSAEKGRKEFTHVPYRIITKDGEVKWVDDWTFIVRDEDGDVTHFKGIVTDITERKKAQEALVTSKDRYALCTRAAKVGVWDWDIANGTFYLDPVIKDFLGYTDEEIPNDLEKWVTYVHPDDSGPVMKAAQDCLDGKTPTYVYEHRMLHKDGSVRWVRVDGTVIRDEKGKPIRMLGTDTDITERKLAELALRRERDNLINMFESMQDGVYIVDKKYDIHYANPVLVKEFGKYEGRKCYEYFHARKRSCSWCKNKDVFTGKTVHWEWYSPKNKRTYDLIDTPMKGPDGQVLKLELFRDITERKKAEEELERHRKHLEELVTERTGELRESEARYRTLFESVPVGIGISTRDGRAIAGNSAICALMGRSLEELKQGNIREFYRNPADRNRIVHLMERDGIVRDEKVELVRKDGTMFTASLTLTPFISISEDAFLTVMEDITPREQVEAALRASAEEWKATFDNVNEMVFIQSQDLRILRANRAFAKTLGVEPEELVGRFCYEVVHGTKEQPSDCPHRRVLETKKSATSELFEPQLGIHFDLSISPLLDEQGEITGTVHVARDITERKVADIALQKSEERYRTLFESVPVGIGIATRDGQAIAGNSTICTLMGYTLEELQQRSIIDVYRDPADRERIIHLLSRDGLVKDERVEMVRKDGTSFIASLTVMPFTAEGEDVTFTLIEDITERVRSEERMRRQLMRFKLEEGGVYLVKESAPAISLEAFGDLVKAGHPGHIISRTPEGDLPFDTDGLAGYIWLAEIKDPLAMSPDIEALTHYIDKLPPRSAVLIDRLDYLLIKNGFDDVLSLVQHLRELSYLQRHILVLSLDPAALDTNRLVLLEKETLDVERHGGGGLGEDLLEVLRFVHRENMAGIRPSFTEIANGVNLSRPTVLARMKRITGGGYAVAHKTGRRKAVELTERGHRLFSR